jgi:rRNA-processing protein FCF1
MKILLDANFLIYCAKQKIDYMREIDEIMKYGYELFIVDNIMQELENLKKKAKKARDKDSAKLALDILKNYIHKNKVKVLETGKTEDGDEAMIKFVDKNKDIQEIGIATADRELKKRLKGKARMFAIRNKRYIELI